ncbi:MAG: prepilin peptidase [Candidatus Omnitrophica bacterium]|nr:prepilin peptidase [Candidatus Omnitrophota bacterium]
MLRQYLSYYPAILILGAVTSYTDLKFNTIRNKHLAYAFLYGIILFASLSFLDALPLQPDKFLANILISIIIAFALYASRLWSAGDAKLFIAFSLLLPVNRYGRLFFFPCLAIFANIAIIGTIAVMATEIVRFAGKPLAGIKKAFSKSNCLMFLNSLAIIFCLTWTAPVFLSRILALNPLVELIILCVSYYLIYAFMNKMRKYSVLIVLVFALGLAARYLCQPGLFGSPAILFEQLSLSAKFSLLFVILRGVFLDNVKVKPESSPDRLPYALFMFLGTILVNSDLIAFIIGLFVFRK